jgi:hypothetical protein
MPQIVPRLKLVLEKNKRNLKTNYTFLTFDRKYMNLSRVDKSVCKLTVFKIIDRKQGFTWMIHQKCAEK